MVIVLQLQEKVPYDQHVLVTDLSHLDLNIDLELSISVESLNLCLYRCLGGIVFDPLLMLFDKGHQSVLSRVHRLPRVGIGVKLGVKRRENLFARGIIQGLLVSGLEKVPYLHIVLEEHLVLLHELDWNAQVLGDGGAYLADRAQLIGHDGHYFIAIYFLFVLERIEMFRSIYYTAEYMPVLHVIVKFYIDFERFDVPVSILHKELLSPLNKNRHARFSENLQKCSMMFRNNLRHQHIDSLAVGVDLVGRVSKQAAELAVRIYDLAELEIRALDQEETRLVHVCIQVVLVLRVLQRLIHRLYLLHLVYVLVVLIV